VVRALHRTYGQAENFGEGNAVCPQ
jgi:hypothetical protein